MISVIGQGAHPIGKLVTVQVSFIGFPPFFQILQLRTEGGWDQRVWQQSVAFVDKDKAFGKTFARRLTGNRHSRNSAKSPGGQ